MPSESVLLIHSEEPGWIAVRTALRTMATVDAIQEALDPSTARELQAGGQPGAILASDVVDGESSLPLLYRLRQEDAFTGILGLFASDLDQQQLLAFSDLFLNGCFLWHELTTVTSVDAAVLAMLSGDLRVASQSVVDSFFLTQQEVDDEEIAAVQLTEREQTILRLLARGITEDAIAQELGRSRRTIERAVHDLQETLQAPDLFVLGMRAAQLRLVP